MGLLRHPKNGPIVQEVGKRVERTTVAAIVLPDPGHLEGVREAVTLIGLVVSLGESRK